MNCISLCAGVEGVGLGLSLVIPDFRTVCYVEIDAYCQVILVQRMGDGFIDPAPVFGDLKQFNGYRWRGVVDLVTAGYPCQPFSVAGRQLGSDDPRHLWPDVWRIVVESGPRYVFIENVAQHLNVGFDVVKRELEEVGYRVEAGLFTAAEVGAPHKRQRLFALAYRENNQRGAGEQQQEARIRANGIGRQRSSGGSDRSESYALADSDITRRQQERRSASRDEASNGTKYSEEPGYSDHEPERVREAMGNNNNTGLQGCSKSVASSPDEFPAWPAGPSERDRWRSILERFPNLEPAILRMARRTPYRMERHRALGNIVVPNVAALAWSTLIRRFI